MTEFLFEGRLYRTNADASIVEGRDGTTWNQTHSIPVILAARKAIK